MQLAESEKREGLAISVSVYTPHIGLHLSPYSMSLCINSPFEFIISNVINNQRLKDVMFKLSSVLV